ncbi:MAG: DUF4433 domain-containing protein [Bacteroidetes bacterium]|nr:DUF4433 domain-containing protein [Bacteroidota bacterium]
MDAIVFIAAIIILILLLNKFNSRPSTPSGKTKKEKDDQLFIKRILREKEEAERNRIELERNRKSLNPKPSIKENIGVGAINILEPVSENQIFDIQVVEDVEYLKDNWEEFRNVIIQNKITTLYHFTDRSNLQSIKQNGGLLSWYYCLQNGIKIPKISSSETSRSLDLRKGLQNYVRVSFVKDHPMLFNAKREGRINDPVLLTIDTRVIYLRDSKYAKLNAVKNGEVSEGSIEKFKSIKFDILKQRYFDLSEEEKPFFQAEVLVLEKIPLEYITNIHKLS